MFQTKPKKKTIKYCGLTKYELPYIAGGYKYGTDICGFISNIPNCTV